jgi:hypothetical protein
MIVDPPVASRVAEFTNDAPREGRDWRGGRWWPNSGRMALGELVVQTVMMLVPEESDCRYLYEPERSVPVSIWLLHLQDLRIPWETSAFYFE